MPAKFDRCFIFGIDQQGEIGLLGARRTGGRIPEQRAADTLAAKPYVGREPADRGG
jgi:hypothetical protein